MSAHQCTMREAAALLGCTAQSLSAFFDRARGTPGVGVCVLFFRGQKQHIQF